MSNIENIIEMNKAAMKAIAIRSHHVEHGETAAGVGDIFEGVGTYGSDSGNESHDQHTYAPSKVGKPILLDHKIHHDHMHMGHDPSKP